MRYQVPQFIEFESKVIGPFSFRQFAYILGGAGGSYLVYKFLGFFPGILVIGPLLALSFALAFVKVNGRQFVDILASAFSFFVGGKLYVWKKVDKPVKAEAANEVSAVEELTMPSLSQSKLKELAWGLDIKQNVFSTHSLEKSAEH
jgi:PrgI family protein